MSVKFGPSGLGGVKEAVDNLEKYSDLGLNACEIAFTYSVYIKNKKDALKIKKAAKKYNIELSIHAPYWINLNSKEKHKVEKSKKYLLECLKVGTWLHAKKIVFHPGFYSGIDKEKTFENIKNRILELQEIRKKEKYTPKLAPETTGKVNVFGSIEDIFRLTQETKCSFCIDFAHILARYKTYNFEEVFGKFKKFKNMHLHFSGIEYAKKGEKHHKKTPEKDVEKLISNLPKNKKIVIINESPYPVEDSIISSEIYRRQK